MSDPVKWEKEVLPLTEWDETKPRPILRTGPPKKLSTGTSFTLSKSQWVTWIEPILPVWWERLLFGTKLVWVLFYEMPGEGKMFAKRRDYGEQK